MLPVAPNDREKLLYVQQDKFFLYSFGVISTLLLVAGGAMFAVHDWAFVWYLPFVAVVFVYLGISYVIGVFSKSFDIANHYDAVRMGRWFKPTVDVFLPSAGEPLDVIENTFAHVAKLDWDRDRLCVYVLDDSGRDAVGDLAYKYGFLYIRRPDRGVLKKAGNVRYAFQRTYGNVIAIFDADFCPRPDYLRELIPYMADQKVAIVQSPQFFRVDSTQTWIQRGSASIQELFYRLIQVNRNSWGASICVGTNAIYRRAALEPLGGTYPIEHSEDVHTGFNCVKDGWRLRYVPLNLAAGLCPEDVDSYLKQQYRWATGSCSLLVNRTLFWGAKIGFMSRLCFLSGMIYYTATSLGLMLYPIPGLIMVWFVPEGVFWYNAAFSLPSFVFGTIFMAIWTRAPYGLSAIKSRQASYVAYLFAIYDRLFGSVMPWVPTGTKSASRRVAQMKRTMVVLSVAPWVLGVAGAITNMGSPWNFNFYPFLAIMTFWCYVGASSVCQESGIGAARLAGRFLISKLKKIVCLP